MDVKELIEKITERTFAIISEIGNEKDGAKSDNTKIIFPKKRDGKIRISEQELKQIFIEQFNLEKDNPYRYSVETPTIYKYRFKGDGAPMVIAEDNSTEGQSALIDMSIHDNEGDRVAIIEFKGLNPESDDFHKDFVKLSCEPDENVVRYFIHLVVEANDGTIQNLCKKYNYSYDNKLSLYKYARRIMILNVKGQAYVDSLKIIPKTIVLCK